MGEIMNGEWKDCFSSRILNRGYEYYENGNVLDIEKTEGGYTATVEGSWEYTVTIDVDDEGDFIDADCDCPYSQEGNYCKHEAAVLYALELDGDEDFEEPDEDEENADSSDDKGIEETVRKMSREDLESLVLELASADGKIHDRIQAAYAEKMSSSYIRKLKDEIRRFSNNIHEAADEWYDEFNDDVEENTGELDDVIGGSLYALIDKKQYSDAFDTALYAWNVIPFDIIEEQTMGGGEDLVNSFISVFRDVYDGADHKLRMAMKGRLSGLFGDLEKDDIRYYPFVKLMLSPFGDRKLASSVIAERSDWEDELSVELCILSYKALGQVSDMWNCILSHLDTETAVGAGLEEYEKEDDMQSLIAFLNKAKDANTSTGRSYRSNSILSSVSTRLLDIYATQNKDDEYTEELGYNILHVWQHDLDRIHDYKKRVDESRWKEFLAKLKTAGTVTDTMPVLLLEENDLDGLMAWVEKAAWYRPSQYEKMLYDYYPDRVVSLARRRAEKACEDMRKRSHYSSFGDALAYLGTYEKGKAAAKNLLEAVMRRYPGRPALRDELKRRGFSV